MSFRTLILFSLLVACGDDTASPRDTSDTSSADTSVEADTTSPDTASPDTTSPDTTSPDTTSPDTTSPDTSSDVPDTGGLDSYLQGCESFFAARIVELQVVSNPSFPSDCNTPLTQATGRLRQGGKAMCLAGETANACRDRLYATPPDLDDLDQACWNGSGPEGCLHGSWVPRCADGSNDCVEDEAVCQDGTRPLIFAEAATEGPSDVWIFHMGGEGGPCTGAGCWFQYRYDEREFALSMSTLHPDGPTGAAQRGGGIMNPENGLPYGRANRVRFERCTDAASDATEEVDVANGVPPELASQFPDFPPATAMGRVHVWYKGFDTWRATFRHLTTLAGRDRDGDGTPEMPSLADARIVILSAASDASMWLTFAADQLATELRDIAGSDLEVRLMIDGMFPPMLDNEARYHPDAPADFDMFNHPYSETGLCLLTDNDDGLDNETCNEATYSAGGGARTSMDTRGLVRDASCAAMHGADSPRCYDRNHVLLHHLDMPVLVIADQEDNTVSDNAPTYGDRSYHWAEPADYRVRIADQGWDIVDHWSTSAREGGAGRDGDFVLVLPKTRREGEPWGKATHVRFHNDDEMNRAMTLCSSAGAEVATVSYNQIIGAWIAGTLPQSFAIEDARRAALPDGSYWVTGASCRAPE